MAYSEITATIANLQHTHIFHKEKMFYYQRLFNQRPRSNGYPLMDTDIEQFYQRLFNIHFQAHTEMGVLIDEYTALADTILLRKEPPTAVSDQIEG